MKIASIETAQMELSAFLQETDMEIVISDIYIGHWTKPSCKGTKMTLVPIFTMLLFPINFSTCV